MKNKENIIAEKLQSIKENKLTKEIIIPLLDSMGYHKVEFYGGPAEEGKDIVFWDNDKTGELNLYVAQVKHFKFTNTASDKNSLQTIVNQIANCFRRKILYTDKSTHLPSGVWLITPYEVNAKTLQSAFSNELYLKDQQIKIIDGIKLASLIIKYKPDIVKKLVGLNIDIASKITPTLNNKILLAALGHHEDKDLKSIYTDIDFSIGKSSTNLFFNSTYKPTNKKIKVIRKDWELFKSLCDKVAEEYGIDFLTKSIDEIDEENNILKDKVKEWRKRKNSVNETLTHFNNEINSLQASYNEKIKISEDYKRRKGQDFNLQDDVEYRVLQSAEKGIYQAIDIKNRGRIKVKNELEQLIKNEPDFYFEVEVNGAPLSKQLISNRKWIEDTVAQFNIKAPDSSELGAFILKCQSIINSSAVIFEHSQFFNCVGHEERKTIRKDFETTRFKFSIDKLFDTGLNFLVLGEAGAGKTTSLQMYTSNRESLTEKIIFWIPLGRLVENWVIANVDFGYDHPQYELEKPIIKYLNNLGISITTEEFLSLAEHKKVVLLLDGIDEAIKVAPWLPSVIVRLTERAGTNFQIIVTSRMSGSYLREIPFFALTLLPFTDDQRDEFITKWFKHEADQVIVNRIRKHLSENKDISDIIRNPLLTTTLCVLARHGLPLPRTEITLYNERIKLLTGYYDSVKNITARISVTPQILETLAQKIAFYLHTENKREEHMQVLFEHMKKLMANDLNPEIAKIAISELFDPCNLMVPMSEDGKYGFGHLRYQEHLAAKEIINNRSIDIMPLLKQQWWRGVLILFARMNTSLIWLIKDLGKDGKVSLYSDVLKDMIAARPKQEHTNLASLMEKYLDLDMDLYSSFEDEY